MSRHSPMASKFSSAKPSWSIWAWQAAQTGLARWAAICSRMGSTLRGSRSSTRSGTSGGGGGGGVPRMFSMIHLPRMTGEVRLAREVPVRMEPWPRSPRRTLSAGRVTRRKRSP